MSSRGFWTTRRRQQLWYAPILALSMALVFLRLLILAKILDLPTFATFSAGLLVSSSFSMLGSLGVQLLIQRDLPGMLLEGRRRRGATLLVQAQFIAIACAVAAWCVAATGLALAGLSTLTLAAAILHGLSQQAFLLATIESRSQGEPLRYARDNLLRSVLLVLTGTTVAMAGLGAMALLAVESVVSLGLSGWLTRNQLASARLAISVAACSAARRMSRISWQPALLLLAVTSVAFVAANADRWFAAEALEAKRFGEYAFAWTVLMVAQSVQTLVNTSVFPMLARRRAASGNRACLRLGSKASVAVLLAAAAFALLVAQPLELAVRSYYPAYSDAVILIPWFLATGMLRVSDFWSSILIIVGREGMLLVLQLAATLVAGVAWWLTIDTSAGVLPPIAFAQLAFIVAAVLYVVTLLAALVAVRKRRDD